MKFIYLIFFNHIEQKYFMLNLKSLCRQNMIVVFKDWTKCPLLWDSKHGHPILYFCCQHNISLALRENMIWI